MAQVVAATFKGAFKGTVMVKGLQDRFIGTSGYGSRFQGARESHRKVCIGARLRSSLLFDAKLEIDTLSVRRKKETS